MNYNQLMELFIVQTCFSYLAIMIGLRLMLRPESLVSFQIVFYRVCNWNMQPISMEKELRNMRATGYLMVVISIFSYYL